MDDQIIAEIKSRAKSFYEDNDGNGFNQFGIENAMLIGASIVFEKQAEAMNAPDPFDKLRVAQKAID